MPYAIFVSPFQGSKPTANILSKKNFSLLSFVFRLLLFLPSHKELLRTVALRRVKRESGVNPEQYQLL